jgi:hypothetical protein
VLARFRCAITLVPGMEANRARANHAVQHSSGAATIRRGESRGIWSWSHMGGSKHPHNDNDDQRTDGRSLYWSLDRQAWNGTVCITVVFRQGKFAFVTQLRLTYRPSDLEILRACLARGYR